jgi:hypothetical protein
MNTESIGDPRLVGAVIAAAASLAIFLLTKVFEVIAAYRERKRSEFAQLMSIRSELEVNQSIAHALLSSAKVPRTLGFRFIDDAWKTTDRSVLYLRHVPGRAVLKIYAMIQHFHLLVERREAIRDQGNHYPNTEEVVAIEREEMISIARSLRDEIAATLQKFPK